MVLLLVLWSGLTASLITSGDSELRIRHRQLTWNDFAGEAPPPGVATAQIATALVVDEIEIRTRARAPDGWISNPVRLEVYAVMFPNRSGVKLRGRTPRVLAHEQGHFDLAELQSRLLADELATISGSGTTRAAASHRLKANLIAVLEQHELLLTELNQRYDQETSHGRKQRSQQKWDRFISRQLAKNRGPQKNMKQ